MKRFLCLVLLIALLIPGALCEKTYPKAEYTLSSTAIDLSGLPVYAQVHALEALGFAAPSDRDGLVQIGVYEDFFKEHALELRYASQSMDTLVFRMQGGGIVCLRGGKLILCAANPNRGAGDPNGRLEYSQRFYGQLNSVNGLIFSPDGKYAAFVDYNQTVTNMKFDYQLTLLDVEEGEYFYAQRWNTRLREENAALVFGAAFDETGEHIYYITYGNQNPYRYSLYRYTLKTGESELLCNHQEEVYRPDIAFINARRLIAPLSSGTEANTGDGIMLYTKKLFGGWETELYTLPVAPDRGRLIRLQTSARTELALAMVNLQPNMSEMAYVESVGAYKPVISGQFLFVIDTKHDCAGLDRILVFNEDVTACEMVPYEEFLTAERYTDVGFVFNYPTLYNACLTPDGTHALTVHRVRDEFALRLLNLKTLEVKTVETPETFDGLYTSFGTAMSGDYRVGINMLSDTLVLINTQDGVKLFELK